MCSGGRSQGFASLCGVQLIVAFAVRHKELPLKGAYTHVPLSRGIRFVTSLYREASEQQVVSVEAVHCA